MLNTADNLTRGLAAIEAGIPHAFKVSPDGSYRDPFTPAARNRAAEMLAGFDDLKPLDGADPGEFAEHRRQDFEVLLQLLPVAAYAAALGVIDRLRQRPLEVAHPLPPYFDRADMDAVYAFVASDVTGLC